MSKKCPACKGSGLDEEKIKNVDPCPDCEGTGKQPKVDSDELEGLICYMCESYMDD